MVRYFLLDTDDINTDNYTNIKQPTILFLDNSTNLPPDST